MTTAESSGREFLVRRLVESEEDGSSDSSSPPHRPPAAPAPTPAPQGFGLGPAHLLAPQLQLQYAALMAAGMMPPFLYPQLYQSLLGGMPDLEKLRLAMQPPPSQPPQTLSQPSGSPVAKCPATPDSGRSASAATLSPSPRKRPSSKAGSKAASNPSSPSKKARATKRLAVDSETASPVSGMFIREAAEVPSPTELQAAADLDESAKFVVMTDEARAEVARIPNAIGDCLCKLCGVRYEDVFALASHRCPRIVHQEYRCSECDKVFSCPANLASHKRWHKPRPTTASPAKEPNNNRRKASKSPPQDQPLDLKLPPSYLASLNNPA